MPRSIDRFCTDFVASRSEPAVITDLSCSSCSKMGSVIPAVIEKRKALSPQHALLVGISGTDASGKGLVTTRIVESLQQRGIKLAIISADGWLNLPHVRFHQQDLAKHFYENAIRFDEKKLLRRLLR